LFFALVVHAFLVLALGAVAVAFSLAVLEVVVELLFFALVVHAFLVLALGAVAGAFCRIRHLGRPRPVFRRLPQGLGGHRLPGLLDGAVETAGAPGPCCRGQAARQQHRGHPQRQR
jgi:hypothetical protein